MSVCPLQYDQLFSYLQLINVTDQEEIADYALYVFALDDTFLDYANKKAMKEREKADQRTKDKLENDNG